MVWGSALIHDGSIGTWHPSGAKCAADAASFRTDTAGAGVQISGRPLFPSPPSSHAGIFSRRSEIRLASQHGQQNHTPLGRPRLPEITLMETHLTTERFPAVIVAPVRSYFWCADRASEAIFGRKAAAMSRRAEGGHRVIA